MCPSGSERSVVGKEDEPETDESGKGLRYVHDEVGEHGYREAEYCPVRAMLEVDQLAQSIAANEVERDSAHEVGADAETDHDDDEIVRERERADDTVEREG